MSDQSTTTTSTPPTLIKTVQTGVIHDPATILPAMQAILAEARAWGLLGVDLEWDKYGRITWIGFGTAKRAVAFWRFTLPEAALKLACEAMADPGLVKLGHNGIQADRIMWERDLGPVSGMHSWQDCHLDATTEFLTERGWLRYRDIPHGLKIAAFDTATGRLSFEQPIARVSKLYSGQLFVLHTKHTHCDVTAAHRLWVRPRKRTSASWTGTFAAPWTFITAAEALAYSTDTFDMRVALEPGLHGLGRLDYAWHDLNLVRLAALYVTDGCLRIRPSSLDARSIIITQIKNGRANELLTSLMRKFPSSYRERRIVRLCKGKVKRLTECVWTFADPVVAQLFQRTFGRYSAQRTLLPDTIAAWSVAAREVFFETLFLGDGTILANGIRRYATASKALAGGVQILALSLGYTATIGRSGATYAVSCRLCASDDRTRAIRSRVKGQNGAFKHSRKVKNARVVCFTTPSGTLVTRSHGKPAFHGNSMLMHHAAFPGVAHDLQQVVSQFLVVPPWKSWREETQRQAAIAAKERAKQEKAIIKAKEKEAKAAIAAAAKAARDLAAEAAKFDKKKQHEARNAAAAAKKAEEKAAAKAEHEARNAAAKAAKAAEKAAAKAEHEARNAAAKAEKAAKKAAAQAEHEARIAQQREAKS